MFYDNLLKECERQGLKITPLVKECGGAAGSISAWKKGAMPNSEIVVRLAVRLNVSSDYLLGIDNTTKEECPSDEEEHLIQIFENEPETKAFFEMALSLTDDEKKDLVKLVKAWIAVQRNDDDNTN